jgi:hypothetical protein
MDSHAEINVTPLIGARPTAFVAQVLAAAQRSRLDRLSIAPVQARDGYARFGR